MPLQDLTPQLRTRLSRMERGVGWFVFIATVLLLFAFGYYLYNVAVRRGWFVVKAGYHTYVSSSTGLRVGDNVTIMGFPVGQITAIYPMTPDAPHFVRIEFDIQAPYFRYILSEGSFVKVEPAGFLDQRQIEVTRGTNGYPICVTKPLTVFTNLDNLENLVNSEPGRWQLGQDVFNQQSNLLFRAYTWLDESNLQRIGELDLPSVTAFDSQERDKHYIVAWWHQWEHAYVALTNGETAWLPVVETPPVADRLQAMITQVQNALPNILALTNQLARILSNGADITSNLNTSVVETHPLLRNADLTLTRLDTNVNRAIVNVNPLLVNANSLVANLNTNVTATLINLAEITSNLNSQVQANSNLLGNIGQTIHHYDTFVQGLKHFWLLRSTFESENKNTNAPPPGKPLLSPRARSRLRP